jgi:hypothetical protein
MKRYKLLKSECSKAWFFNVSIEGNFLKAGFACFLPGNNLDIIVSCDGAQLQAALPSKVINNVLPVRVVNARLCLL